jgi:hypothetical protein
VKSLPTTAAMQPTLLQSRSKEEDTSALTGRRVGPGLGENSIRGQSPPPATTPLNGSPLVPPVMDLNKRLSLTGGDDRPPAGGGLSQQFAGTLGAFITFFTHSLWYRFLLSSRADCVVCLGD